jgi:hypothetical protein
MNRFMSTMLALSLSLGAHSVAFGQSPYSGRTDRPVKALSAEQIEGLRAGRGMGFALAAELNGYPGPLHALEVADAMHLSAEQREKTQALYDQMLERSKALGERIVELEIELDTQFANRAITEDSLRQLTARIAEATGELRFTHLRYHLEMTALLRPHQIELYNQARGYGAGGGAHGGHGHHGHH